ncbi:unnamed protein product [Periconia digitata]|uniref:CoA-transferase family III n=1 Tax=Periconia digitata TaxID=1303443 RepID=A0A9W4UMZ3_9PLEO|nr:unnamed protein product [Periconia digitata]
MNRQDFTPFDTVSHIWESLQLPATALDSLDLIEDGKPLPSSFKVEHLVQASIAVSALSASLFHATRNGQSPVIPKVSVPLEHACIEFISERVYTLDSKSPPSAWGAIGGLHKCADGYVRIHDGFPHHQRNALHILGLPDDATRDDVAGKTLQWSALGLERQAIQGGAVIVALRSFEEWDAHPQSKAIADFPIAVKKLGNAAPYLKSIQSSQEKNKCLEGIRVVELSRVIAAPVAGKTLAAHGADVIWVTSPNLPDKPELDRDLARGKRSVQLDIKEESDMKTLRELLRTADVFIQSYRPGSLAKLSLSPEEIVKLNPNLIVANLSAYGPDGPWRENRGFDSLVQTCSGLNVADAERYGEGEPARVLPCQALDHGAGYLLATGVMTALYRRAMSGGSFEVQVSLAGVGKYLRSLGQRDAVKGGDSQDEDQYLEKRQSDFGELRAVRHSAAIEGLEVGWDIMSRVLGSDVARWQT